MDMRESQLFLYSRLIREAHRHVKAEEGLSYAQAFIAPKPLVEDLYGKTVTKPEAREQVIDWAEKIRRMPDSGSFSSNRRVERRKRSKQ
jgi:hypothetical protein